MKVSTILLPSSYFDGKRVDEDLINEFYIGGEVATICRNSLQPAYTPEPPRALVEKYNKLPSEFYTLDFAELADGGWKILEAGDGSVSGHSEGQNLETFYRTMFVCLNH